MKWDTTWSYFRKPIFTEGTKWYMDNPESKEWLALQGNYFTTFQIDFRLGEEEEEKFKDLNEKGEGAIRMFIVKGYDRLKDWKYLDTFKLKVTQFKLFPHFPKLSISEQLSTWFTETIKYLWIGYDFRNEQLSTKQAELQGRFFKKNLEHFPNLKFLMIWGFPISSVLLALSLMNRSLDCLKIVAGSYRNYHFDKRIGEIHWSKGVYEYRNKTSIFRISWAHSLKMLRDSKSPLSEKTTINEEEYLEILWEPK